VALWAERPFADPTAGRQLAGLWLSGGSHSLRRSRRPRPGTHLRRHRVYRGTTRLRLVPDIAETSRLGINTCRNRRHSRVLAAVLQRAPRWVLRPVPLRLRPLLAPICCSPPYCYPPPYYQQPAG
jgi:hypothetical protein